MKWMNERKCHRTNNNEIYEFQFYMPYIFWIWKYVKHMSTIRKKFSHDIHERSQDAHQWSPRFLRSNQRSKGWVFAEWWIQLLFYWIKKIWHLLNKETKKKNSILSCQWDILICKFWLFLLKLTVSEIYVPSTK